MTKRLAVFGYGVVSYAASLIVFVYAVGFVGNYFVPQSLDSAPRVPFTQALMIDVLLLAAFALQHSVMARPGFKRILTRIIPEAAERSTYVLASSLAMIALFAWWQPIGGTVWNVTGPIARSAITSVYFMGFGLVLMATLLINHFDLFGLRQVWLFLIGKPYTNLEFRTPLFYKYVRHPLYIGWLMFFWATPVMTSAHLLFALMTTAYILLAIRWEERDLIAVHGKQYENYRTSVPKLVPSFVAYRGLMKPIVRSQRRAA
ncbi:MAG TPA: isoprenylcysteine carboxylmethyltransferase family protein [Terriglobales bacterium]